MPLTLVVLTRDGLNSTCIAAILRGMGWRFRTKLQAIVRRSMAEGYPSVERVAERLNVRVRTLQRRLQEQGLTYSDLVETFRYREASRMLQSTQRPVAAIAASLGYKDPSHFSRAFLRWSGMRPTQFRSRHHSEPEGRGAS